MKDLTGALSLYVANLEFTLTDFYSQRGDKKIMFQSKLNVAIKASDL